MAHFVDYPFLEVNGDGVGEIERHTIWEEGVLWLVHEMNKKCKTSIFQNILTIL